MGYKVYLVILLNIHLIGDFYLQTEGMARDKSQNIKSVIIHSVCYTIPIFLFFLIFNSKSYVCLFNLNIPVILFILIIPLSHFIIDTIKYFVGNRCDDWLLFFIDQFLHLIFIIMCSWILFVNNIQYNYLISELNSISELNISLIMNFLFVILFVGKTSNIIIKKIISFSNNNETKNKNDSIKTGRVIGILERLIIVSLLYNGSYSSISFIIAAKSLARFKKFDEKDFAEYYLIGTLSSVLLSLLAWYIIK